jgi:hypothetical protein
VGRGECVQLSVLPVEGARYMRGHNAPPVNQQESQNASAGNRASQQSASLVIDVRGSLLCHHTCRRDTTRDLAIGHRHTFRQRE